MKQNTSQQDSSSPQKRRRTRNDYTNRNFVCGCGKSYLSYPALYTHLKQKHDGIQPNGTILPQIKFNSRAKPKENSHNSNNKAIGEKSDILSNNNSSLFQEEEESMKDLLKFFERNGMLNTKESKNQTNETELQRNLTRSINLMNFPKEIFKNEEDYQTILNILNEIDKNQRNLLAFKEKEKTQQTRELIWPPITCNKIFCKFLYEISKYLKIGAYKEMVLFICLLRKALNMIGWRQNQSNGEEKIQEFCEYNNADQILEYSNEFITKFLPVLLNEYEDIDLEFIGKGENKIKNSIFLTQYFANWLHCNNYTKVKIQLNYEEIKL